MNARPYSLHPRQRGVTTLMVALMIVISLTLLTFMAAKVSVTEHKIAANEYRSKQAFEAAQAGIEFGIKALQENTATIIADDDGDGQINPYVPSTAQNTIGTLSNNSRYTVQMQFLTPFSNTRRQVLLTATGSSDDNTSTRVVRQLVLATPVLLNPPPAPIISRNSIELGGNMRVTNDISNVSVMSGRGANTTGNASASIRGTAPSGCSSDGLCANQTDLAISGDAFFQKFFGMTKAQYKAVATNVSSVADLAGQYAAGARVFWFEGDLAVHGGAYGTLAAPMLLVVNGNVKMNAGTTFTGLIYGIGKWEVGGGNSTITGAAAIEDNADTNDSKMNGTPDTRYNTGVFTTLANSNLSFAKVVGGWSDF